ncbi:MAG: hypothetical protein CMP10_06365 [Zetaproteobacteria bacterium]|nr:hypothetical protein [Pseudobdellovibrionaceae bacterium]|tara:strand:+ start:316 stop:543 length:228 start_codon:yes stop_codon:yes gene_type:complete
MGKARKHVEAQIENASANLQGRVKILEERKVAASSFKSDPMWRKLNGELKKRKNQLAVIEKKEEKARGMKCNQQD